MRIFSYAWSLPVTWQRRRSYHSLDRSQPPPMLHADFMAVCFIEPKLWPIEVIHCWNRGFGPFLLLWLWLWPDDVIIRTWPVSSGDIPDERKWTSYVKAFESIIWQTYRHTYSQTADRQTPSKTYTTPLRGWSTKTAEHVTSDSKCTTLQGGINAGILQQARCRVWYADSAQTDRQISLY